MKSFKNVISDYDINTPYYVDTVESDNGQYMLYMQVVRTKDDVILYANSHLENIKAALFDFGINKGQVTWL